MRLRTFSLIAILSSPAYLLVSTSAGAATAKRHVSTLKISHESGTLVLESDDGVKRTLALEPTVQFEVLPDEQVRIFLQDPNPVLFAYKSNVLAPTENPDYTAAKGFADAVKALTTALGGPKPQAAALDCVALPSSLTADPKGASDRACFQTLFQPALKRLVEAHDQIAQLTKKCATSSGAAAVKKGVADGDFSKTATTIRNGLALASQSAFGILEALASSNATTGNPDAPVQTKKDAASPAKSAGATKAADKKSPPNPGAGGAPKAEPKVTPTADPDPPRKTVLTPAVADDYLYIAMVNQLATKIEGLLKAVEAFNTLVLKIDEPLDLGSLEYSAQNLTGLELVITVADADAAKASTRKTGSFTFKATGYSPVHLTIGAALVYSFVRQPSYSTKHETDGTIRIIRTDTGDDYTAAQVGAMLSIQPRAWSNPAFGGALNLGIGTNASKIGLYAGGALRVYGIVALGAGLAFQQTDQLNAGLSENQIISKDEDLKTHKAFRSGLYLTATVSLK